MKIIVALLIAASLGGCVPMLIGGAAGVIVAHHEEARHYRCMRYFGNPDCLPGYGAHRGWIYMPMGVHQ